MVKLYSPAATTYQTRGGPYTKDSTGLITVTNPNDLLDLILEGCIPVSMSAALRSPRVGVVASRAGVMTSNSFGALQQWMSRTAYVALDAISSLQLLYSNWNAGGNAESVSTSAATVQASIEYPIGVTVALVSFNGALQGTIPIGGDILSDALPITIPIGARFAVRTWASSANGLPYASDGCGVLGANAIDGSGWGATVPNLVNATGTLSGQGLNNNSFNTLAYRPTAVLGSTSLPCVALWGDSILLGAQDTVSDMQGSIGTVLRGLTPLVPTFQLSSQGAALLSTSAAGMSKRRAYISSYATHILSNFGANDYTTQSVGAMQTQLTAIVAQMGLPWWHCTLTPAWGATTDNWATVANQTASASNSVRGGFNGWIRGGGSPITGMLDVSSYLDNGGTNDSGIWIANGTAQYYTPDGIHPKQVAAQLLLDRAIAARMLASVR